MSPDHYAAYMPRRLRPHRFAMPLALGPNYKGASRMLDVAYILVGAAFLGACVLYAYACEQL